MKNLVVLVMLFASCGGETTPQENPCLEKCGSHYTACYTDCEITQEMIDWIKAEEDRYGIE